MNFPSKLIEEAVEQLATLPGIGKKTALRLALSMLKREESEIQLLAEALVELRSKIKYCKRCHSIADDELCSVCSNTSRDQQTICLVENTTDVLAIESTSTYQGMFHVLGGVISPIEGIRPSDLNIDSLLNRIDQEGIKEVIFALNSSMEADTTSFYISKKLKERGVKISTIARGIPVGGELEFTDEVTLSRSLAERINYQL